MDERTIHEKRQIAEHEDEILESLAAAAEVDLALARGRLGTKTKGTIPKVLWFAPGLLFVYLRT